MILNANVLSAGQNPTKGVKAEAYLVTGGAGFIGSNIVKELLQRKKRVFLNDCPVKFQKIIKKYLKRIEKNKKSADGAWNLEEMHDYDKGVDTYEQREKMLADIKMRPYGGFLFLAKIKSPGFSNPIAKIIIYLKSGAAMPGQFHGFCPRHSLIIIISGLTFPLRDSWWQSNA